MSSGQRVVGDWYKRSHHNGHATHDKGDILKTVVIFTQSFIQHVAVQ